MNEPNELDNEFAAMFSRRLEQNREQINSVDVQAAIHEKTASTTTPRWLLPAVLGLASLVLIFGFVFLGPDESPSVRVDIADQPDIPTEPAPSDTQPPSTNPTETEPAAFLTPPFDYLDIRVSNNGEVIAEVGTDEYEVLWTPDFAVDSSLLNSDPKLHPNPDVFRSDEGLWFRLVPQDRRLGCDTGYVFRFDYTTGAVEEIQFADSIAGPSTYVGLVALVHVNTPEGRWECGGSGVEIRDTSSATVIAEFTARDGNLGAFIGGENLIWSFDATRLAFDARDGLGESMAVLIDTSDPAAPVEIPLRRDGRFETDRAGRLGDEHIEGVTSSNELLVQFESYDGDPAAVETVRWGSDGTYVGMVNSVDVELPELTVAPGRVGPLSLPATDADVQTAFPEADGWTATPAEIGDGVPALRVAYRGVDQIELVLAADGQYSTALAVGENFTDGAGLRIGMSLDDINEQFGPVTLQTGETHDVSITIPGAASRQIGYLAGNRDLDIVPFVEGSDPVRTSSVWNPGSYLSEFFVR